MKTKKLIYAALLFIFSAGMLGAQETMKTKAENDKTADLLVNKILKVKPYEVVIIAGNQDQIELMSTIYVTVRKAGGFPTVELWLPKAGKQALMETPDEYLKATNAYEIFKNRMVDCYIGIGSDSDPSLYADVPESKFVAAREGGVLFNRLTDHFRYRAVWIGQASGVPTKEFAKSVNANYEEMLTGFWKSIYTDYNKLAQRGKKLAEIFKAGAICNISSKSGTDISFKIDIIPARINCGNISENQISNGSVNIWLPAGEAYTCVAPGSANGKIVVPASDFRGIKIKNLEIMLKNGRIIGLKADENIRKLKEMFDMAEGDDDMLSLVDIGINEDSHPYKGSDFLTYEMGGILSIYFGNNAWAGGNNNSLAGYTVFLDGATLSIDGKVVVKDGNLVLD
jgi:leucyl aminopeptidase (aminopeptidase T)